MSNPTDDETLAVDEFIQQSLRGPKKRPFRPGEQFAPRGEHFLPDEVRTADLTKYSEAALEGRLAQYERDYAFENDPRKRAEFKGEVHRTTLELNRRKMYRQKEAERVFKL